MAAYTYILASHSRVLYIGMSDDIRRRTFEHKTQFFPECFTAKYRVDQLVYFEEQPDGRTALTREAQLKRWTRTKKIALIEKVNSRWLDLSDRWFTQKELNSGRLEPTAQSLQNMIVHQTSG